MKSKLRKSETMAASVSSSSMSSSSNGGGGGCRDCHGVSVTVCHLCDTMTPQNGPCPMMSCTPIDALPGHYQDQQRYPLPPIPRERGRSRATTRGRAPGPPSGVPPNPHPMPPPNNQVQVFCSPVILSTSGVEKGQGGGTPTSSSSKWGRPSGGSRQSRQRSASAKRQPDSRQRQGASLIRQPSLVIQTTAAASRSSESSEATAYSDNCPLCQPRYSKSPERLRMRPSQPQHTVIYF